MKSTKKSATGKKMVDVPSPATVPIIIDKNATRKNNMLKSYISLIGLDSIYLLTRKRININYGFFFNPKLFA